jgi:hypothetical protein
MSTPIRYHNKFTNHLNRKPVDEPPLLCLLFPVQSFDIRITLQSLMDFCAAAVCTVILVATPLKLLCALSYWWPRHSKLLCALSYWSPRHSSCCVHCHTGRHATQAAVCPVILVATPLNPGTLNSLPWKILTMLYSKIFRSFDAVVIYRISVEFRFSIHVILISVIAEQIPTT